MTRACRQWLARLLIGVLLFGQFAVAAYACPGLTAALEQARHGDSVAANRVKVSSEAETAASSTAAAEIAMDCEQMSSANDAASPNLCAEHCRYGQQSDQTGTLAAPAVLLSSLYIVAPLPRLARTPLAYSQVGLSTAVSPPHAILHCCFRD